ncbi:MAG TPA: hypothetical protein VG325_11545 [Solirubrobacteraceae bacterium]|nr:hypothetical protein [Solirubrobacteraceae bacterium]
MVLVIGVAVLIVQSGAEAQPTIPKHALRIEIGAAPVSRPVPAGFIGLSIEYPSAISYFGSDPAHPNPLFVALVRQLTPNQSPVIRFGGDTADWTWWPTPGVARPPGVRYSLGARWVRAVRATAEALDARLILGVNFEADSVPVARMEADNLLTGLGRRYIAGFELGNEPEVYGTLGWYENSQGVGVPGRASSYGFGAYLPDYARVSAALPSTVPLVGPAAGAPAWLAGLRQYLVSNARVRVVTFHRYPLHRCFTPRTSPAYPTIANLLSAGAAAGPADSLEAAVRVAHAQGLPLRSDELNSVSCGGARGVSNTFASSLWILNTLFNMARAGVDGVNIHTFRRAIYEPFAFGHEHGRWTAEVKPMYYGMLMFARAAPPGARLLSSTAPAPGPVRVWATRAPGARVRVVLINGSLRRWITTAVRTPGPGSTATTQRLRARRVSARSGVAIAGQTFGSTTSTAALTGSLRQAALSRIQGRFVVRLPPASATLLTVGGS